MDLESIIGKEEIEVDMSPMIDMVFLLLIFFIVASVIVDDKVSLEVPSAHYAKVPEDITDRFILSVTHDKTIYIEPGKQKVTLEELKEVLAPEVSANPNLRIMIRADGKLTYEESEKIMEACAEVGANDLIYAAFEK